jgi:beta-galactosidase
VRRLGVCYYPEHWPEEGWAEDARRMRAAGLTLVRIGEFAWSRLEPEPGRLEMDWLARAIDTLRAAGLGVVLGTPTATPPRWMLERHPDMLAVDARGRRRGFGSRRHYCFAHAGYRAEAARIAGLLAQRFGRVVTAWQTDNEYGCHDTVASYSPAAAAGFRDWLARRYQSPEALNRAWGNVFWSMEYADWAEIDPPALTVTEANPAHLLDYRRYLSDEVAAFNAAQLAAIRAHSDAPVAHNYMGRETGFDHWALGAQMEIASWDSYPLGFLLDRVGADEARQRAYLRQGDPDFQAFHHDLYRGVGAGRWWVMEQQPGPVNWAPWNPAPLPGMLRLWAWEAFAHGAEAVLPFRWRQFTHAQEQEHAGLLHADGSAAPGLAEIAQVAAELAEAPEVATGPAPVALVFDYHSQWAWEAQPQGEGFDHFGLAFDLYRACRRLGLSLDVIAPDTADLSPWRMVLLPGLLTLPAPLRAALGRYEGLAVTGPRTGLKTAHHATALPPGPGIPGLDLRVARVETLPPFAPRPLRAGGAARLWLEHAEGSAAPRERTQDGAPILWRAPGRAHLAAWPDAAAARRILRGLAREAGIETHEMPAGLRLRDAGPHRFVLNYAAEPRRWQGRDVAAAGILRLPRA